MPHRADFPAIEVTVFPAACRAYVVLLFVAMATTATAASADSRPSPAASLAPCTLPGVAHPARCGSIEVPENPDKPDGRQLSLNIVVLPARNGHALPDPVAFLSGGPGQAATSDPAHLSTILAGINEERDLLLLDQRGTGKSAPLRCPLVDAADTAPNLRDIFPPAAIKRCIKALSATADLTQYSLRHFARDLETVRVALGYESLNLYGFSYGTRAAQVYLRTYPKTSRTAYLGSMAPIDADVLLEFPDAAEQTLVRTFDACAADAACHAAFPALRQEFATLLARLDSGSIVVTTAGTNTKVTLSRGRFAERLRSMLYTPESAVSVPWVLHQAHEGNWQPLADGMLDFARSMDAQASMGLFFSITCNEDVAFLREADIRARATPVRRLPHSQPAGGLRAVAALPRARRLSQTHPDRCADHAGLRRARPRHTSLAGCARRARLYPARGSVAARPGPQRLDRLHRRTLCAAAAPGHGRRHQPRMPGHAMAGIPAQGRGNTSRRQGLSRPRCTGLQQTAASPARRSRLIHRITSPA